MKLYIHDERHGRVHEGIEISDRPEVLEELEKIVDFLNDQITSRYNRLVIAKSYKTEYDEEHDYSETTFEY